MFWGSCGTASQQAVRNSSWPCFSETLAAIVQPKIDDDMHAAQFVTAFDNSPPPRVPLFPGVLPVQHLLSIGHPIWGWV